MSAFGAFNWLDVILVLFLMGGLIVGFSRGLLWEFIGLASLYIGTVIASQYYYFLTEFLRQVAGHTSSDRLLSGVAFLFLLFLVTLIVSWMVFDAFRATKLKLYPSIDHLGGTTLGIASTVVLIILLTPILAFVTSEPWPPGWTEDIRAFVALELKSSFLLPIFNTLKPLMIDSLKPWLPFGLPSILNL